MTGWDWIRVSRSRLGSESSSRTVYLGCVQPQHPAHCTIHCNDRDANLLAQFKGNSISTTKYNIITFLPKGLFEQFRRVANLYFLLISILSTTPIRIESGPKLKSSATSTSSTFDPTRVTQLSWHPSLFLSQVQFHMSLSES